MSARWFLCVMDGSGRKTAKGKKDQDCGYGLDRSGCISHPVSILADRQDGSQREAGQKGIETANIRVRMDQEGHRFSL
jgi:hypothetical protein